MDPFLRDHLAGVSRTYAVLIPMLPRGLAESVGLSYLLMRVVDTIEDDPGLENAERARRLHILQEALQSLSQGTVPERDISLGVAANAGETDAERRLMAELETLWARLAALPPAQREPIARYATAMCVGVLELLARATETGLPYPAVRDAQELRGYCYYVAGVVGEMLCELMSDYLEQPALLRLRPLAVELGIGLQLVNILKDGPRDALQGRCYLPRPAGGDVSSAEIYRFVLQEARTSLLRGVEFVLALPAAARELRYFCGLPIAWGAMTLARAERQPGRGKVGRGSIRSSIDLFRRLATNDQLLRAWFERMLTQPSGAARA